MKIYLIILILATSLSSCKSSRHTTEDIVIHKQDSTTLVNEKRTRIDLSKIDLSKINIIEIELFQDTSTIVFSGVESIPFKNIKSVKQTTIDNNITEDLIQTDTTQSQQKTVSKTKEEKHYVEKLKSKSSVGGGTLVWFVVICFVFLLIIAYILFKRYLKPII